MKIFDLPLFIVLHKLSLNQFDNFKQSKQTRTFIKTEISQARKKECLKSNNKKIFLVPEFSTQVTMFRNTGTQSRREQYSRLEQQSVSNQLINQLKSAQISLQSKMVNIFVYRLSNLNELQKELVRIASSDSNHAINISSSFAMSKEQKQKLLRVVRAKINTHAQVEFQTGEDSSLGIELRDRGYKICSNLDYCITELEEKIENQGIKEKSKLKQLVKA